VKCNILRAFSNFPYESCRTLVIESLRDPNEHVARRAAQYLLENAPPQDADQLWRFAKDSLPTPIHLVLYQAANRHLPAYRVEFRDAINAELRQKYGAATSPYEKAAAIRALGEFAWNYRYIYREGLNATDPIVKTAAVDALKQVSERSDFTAFFGLSSRRVSRELGGYFLEIIRRGEPGPTAIAAGALRFEDRDFGVADSTAVLLAALERMELPAMTETYNELQVTINHLLGKEEYIPEKPKYNHPIDWKLLESVGDRPQLLLTTNRGDVTLQLWPGTAPGSVANILALAKEGFLKDKAFHRVVPNFVIQGGSPSGDAYGSLDYSIRSELSDQHYDVEGLLGMASAGLDTEGTQFFITHSPTLHLDGNYTIFGQVVNGMDIVHEIQVGDRILEAKIIPTKK
jgi:cyclophilin family peptidyl-prolyl cis-trans isomerase